MNNLQKIRKDSGYTQEDIAKRLNITQQAYANYEKSGSSIPKAIANKIADILMVDPSILSYYDELEDDSVVEFLYKSLTPFHAVKNTISLLEKEGFIPLEEEDSWNIKEGGKYYITKNSSAIIAFKVNEIDNITFNIASCHTDSPCLKIKGNGLIDSLEGKRINVERYGGLINYSFMDVPLRIGGRALVEAEEGIKQKIITSSFLVNIPSLCIHHNPTVNAGTELKNQSDMLPLIGECDDLYQKLSPNEKIIDGDLYCVNAMRGTYSGVNHEYLVAPRIDNLTSLYAIIKAISVESTKGISVLYASDNEEIGSLSKQGAESIFIENVLKRIMKALNKQDKDYFYAINNGFLLSIDNGHAAHPAHMENYDPIERVTLNGGVVIKHHPNYATDGVSSSIVKAIAKIADVKIQEYYNNSDKRCGSTIGLISSAQLGINTCDIGLAQLAMHSGIETVGKYDIKRLIQLIKTFYNIKIRINKNDISLN